MITYYFRTLKDDGLKEVTDVRNGVWAHVESPTEEDVQTLVKEFGLDEAILADARDFFEVPRLEPSGNANYFFTRYPYQDKEEDADTAPLLIVTGESFVITVAQREVPQFKEFFDGTEVIFTTQKAKFFLQIMSVLVRSYEKELVELRRGVARNRSKLRQIGNRDIVRLVGYEHRLNDIVSALVPTNTWLNKVPTGNYLQLFNEDMELMEDIMITNQQLIESARNALKNIQNIRSASATILTNNLNATIRTLTVLTIILTIPTLIASLYGMNVPLPLQDHAMAFWLVLTFIGMIVSLVFWVFYKNRWF